MLAVAREPMERSRKALIYGRYFMLLVPLNILGIFTGTSILYYLPL
jgi:hypothetical protein